MKRVRTEKPITPEQIEKAQELGYTVWVVINGEFYAYKATKETK